MDKEEYRSRMEILAPRLGRLQRELREKKIPLLIAVEGWEGAGKGTLINNLIQALDPRGYAVFPTTDCSDNEKLYPAMWRFWNRIPGRGRIVIFDQSWYRALLSAGKKIRLQEKLERQMDDVCSFERTLADDGMILVKIFLHISRSEQEKRFLKIERDPELAWKVGKDDWKQNGHYKRYRNTAGYVIEKTSQDCAPWHVLAAHDRRLATVLFFEKVIAAIEERLQADHVPLRDSGLPQTLPPCGAGAAKAGALVLDDETYRRELDRLQDTMRRLEYALYRRRIPVGIVSEGWDAAGKGGNIRRLVAGMEPRGYEVIPVAAPSDIEKQHHYLWRFWREVPKAGHIAIFDRSWYGRVLVERVEGFCSVDDWMRAYREINDFERQLADAGCVMVKLWLDVSEDEQLLRFNERQETPDKQWKITDEDWRNREKRPQYALAVDDMLALTSTVYAPWTVIDSNDKRSARIQALKQSPDVSKGLWVSCNE
jgi:polyphosphate:AMP phosphotransferase